MLTTNNPYDKFFSIANLYENKENEFRSKYPELSLAMNWDFMIEYRHGRSNNTVEVTIFRLYEHLEDFQNWLNKLDTLQYRLRREYINQRLNKIREYISFLESNNELTRLANEAFLSSLLEDLEVINYLKSKTVRSIYTNKQRKLKIAQSTLSCALEKLRLDTDGNPINGRTQDEVAVLGYLLFRDIENKRFKNTNGIRTCLNSAYTCTEHDFERVKDYIYSMSNEIKELLESPKVKNEVKKLLSSRRSRSELPVIKNT
jgi:hypothetical protein